jgi:hypothetical protein
MPKHPATRRRVHSHKTYFDVCLHFAVNPPGFGLHKLNLEDGTRRSCPCLSWDMLRLGKTGEQWRLHI